MRINYYVINRLIAGDLRAWLFYAYELSDRQTWV